MRQAPLRHVILLVVCFLSLVSVQVMRINLTDLSPKSYSMMQYMLSTIPLRRAFVPQAAAFRGVRTKRIALGAARSEAPARRVEFLRTASIAVISVAGLLSFPGRSHADKFVDNTLGFEFEAPQGWERSEGEISGRRKLIIYKSATNSGASAIVVYTPMRGDFTSLGSFGTLEEVSKTVLPEGEGVSSVLVDSYRQGNSYVYDYIVNQEGRKETHFKTRWLLFPDQGQLATVTVQAYEADYGQLGKDLDNIIASIKTI